MLNTVDFYYFSPTGGTKRAGEAIAHSIAETVNEIDLAGKDINTPYSDVVVVAVPVFGGRIPSIAGERIAGLDGQGKRAITAVVYGVRAYEDALLELNDVVKNCGFQVIASVALVAQHSIVPEVGMGRPDGSDMLEIHRFAERILNKMEAGNISDITVPGNRPYKERMKSSATPVTLSTCGGCGYCASVCPAKAISMTGEGVTTDAEKCIMCMACRVKCPTQSRILPPEIQGGMAQRLGVFKDVRRENEFFE